MGVAGVRRDHSTHFHSPSAKWLHQLFPVCRPSRVHTLTDAREMKQKFSAGKNYTDYILRNRACSQSMFSLKQNT